MRAELDSLAPGERKRLLSEREELLTARERMALSTPPAQWKTNLTDAWESAQKKTLVTDAEVAELAPENSRRKARRLARELGQKTLYQYRVSQYQETVAYMYWLRRADLEQTEEMTKARELVYNAKKALDEARLSDAKKLYDESWDIWAKLFEENQILYGDLAADDLADHLKSYIALLRQMDEEFPRDFKLRFLLEDSPVGQALPLPTPGRITPESGAATPGSEPPSITTPDTAKPAEAKPADPKPAEEKPAEDKPAEDKPAEDKPAEDKPAEDKPAEDKPAEDKPAEDKPAEDKPAEAKPAEEKPAEEAKPAEKKPAEAKSDDSN